MNKVTLITTRNSVYSVSVSDLDAEVRCLLGTFAGQAWEVPLPALETMRLEAGRGMEVQTHSGVLRTSTVLTIQGTTLAPRPEPVIGFVQAVVEHVREQAAPRAVMVDDPYRWQ